MSGFMSAWVCSTKPERLRALSVPALQVAVAEPLLAARSCFMVLCAGACSKWFYKNNVLQGGLVVQAQLSTLDQLVPSLTPVQIRNHCGSSYCRGRSKQLRSNLGPGARQRCRHLQPSVLPNALLSLHRVKSCELVVAFQKRCNKKYY